MEWAKPAYASEYARDFNHDLIFDDILSDDELKPSVVLKKLANFENSIESSILNGDFKLLKINKVKTEDGYDDPMSIGAFKATYVWNFLYPENQIELPGRAYVLKINLSKPKDFAELSVKNPEMFQKLTKLFENERIKKSGLSSIALPVDIKTIPEWLKPYIALEEIITANTNLSLPILKSLGVTTINKTKSNQFFSNIVAI